MLNNKYIAIKEWILNHPSLFLGIVVVISFTLYKGIIFPILKNANKGCTETNKQLGIDCDLHLQAPSKD